MKAKLKGSKTAEAVTFESQSNKTVKVTGPRYLFTITETEFAERYEIVEDKVEAPKE